MKILDYIKNSSPRGRDIRLENHSYLTSLVLKGTLIITSLMFALLLVTYLVSQNNDLLMRIAIGLAALLYLLVVALLLRKGAYKISAWMLIILYSILSIVILHNWSINAPVGILILGFVIFLSNLMLGSAYIIRVTIAVIALLGILYFFDYIDLYNPDRSALALEPTLGDVASYAILFSIFALIAWISSKLRERNLDRALSAERALQKEKDSLALRLEEQTKILRKTQQKEMLQLYQFAELGQLTTIILHDLANNLSVLSLDIDDLDEGTNASEAISRTRESIGYLENMVAKVRRHVNKEHLNKKFDVNKLIGEIISEISEKNTKTDIEFVMKNDKIKSVITGDPLRFTQVLNILINNAIEARPINDSRAKIRISTSQLNKSVRISVTDYGLGIPVHARYNLFQPLRSTKKKGLGMGLFVAKQIVETHFKGSLKLDPSDERTTFILRLPKKNDG